MFCDIRKPALASGEALLSAGACVRAVATFVVCYLVKSGFMPGFPGYVVGTGYPGYVVGLSPWRNSSRPELWFFPPN